MTFQTNFPFLSETTIVPQDENLFIAYFSELYGELAGGINTRDTRFYLMQISSVATNIPLIGAFGSFLITVAGQNSSQPVLSAALSKSDSGIAGVINVLSSQAGTGAWAANTLTITSTATNFQIAHNRAGVTDSFNIRIVGT